ncbi:MAG: replication/maintenance protein RepL [bacterium]
MKMKRKMDVIQAIHRIGRLVFTTREIAGLTGSPLASTTQNLRRLEQKGVIRKIAQGVWGFADDPRFSPFLVIPFLNPRHQAYLSFISALHSHGVISQIPQVITVASTAHSRVVKTSVGTYEIHQISPDFFDGFDWHAQSDYLIASPEKALVDCLYLASRRKRQFANFPELNLDLLKKREAIRWAKRIKDPRIQTAVLTRLAALFHS